MIGDHAGYLAGGGLGEADGAVGGNGFGVGVATVPIAINWETVTNLNPFASNSFERSRHCLDRSGVNIVRENDRARARFPHDAAGHNSRTRAVSSRADRHPTG